ncbi:acyl-CoA thioesterase [Cellulomonas endometrii]|uniref:acyl-CoA thioesterase n=1 Tax=Cellulomonas endometrii TaxID=3036301 RepID=UPI0024ADEBB2|nr:thioesterase family protein [Cellulomonas endometrii]
MTETAPTPARRGRVTMQVRWSDVDLFAHVNNAAYLRFLDDARFALFPSMGVDPAGRPTDSLLVVVKHEIEYLAPLSFRPAPIAVDVWIPRIGRSSVDFAYEVVDVPQVDDDGGSAAPAPGADPPVYLRARSRMVQLDRETHEPRPFTSDERAVFEAFPGEAPVLHGW